MSYNQKDLTIDDIIASHAVNGDKVLGWTNIYDKKYIVDYKSSKPESNDVTRIKLTFITAEGKKVRPLFKFTSQLVCGKVKDPSAQKKDSKETVSKVKIPYKLMDKKDIGGGDYTPKKMANPEAQDKEDKRVVKVIDTLAVNNIKFIEALDILHRAYLLVASELIAFEKDKKITKGPTGNLITIQKNAQARAKNIEPDVHSFAQTHITNPTTGERDPIDHPLYRISIDVCKDDPIGRIGKRYKKEDPMKQIVFDVEKATKANNYKTQPASVVDDDGKQHDLTYKNIGEFITYKSLTGGKFEMSELVCSKVGISCSPTIMELYVVRHKTKTVNETMSADELRELREMRGDIGSDEEIEDMPMTSSKAAESESIPDADAKTPDAKSDNETNPFEITEVDDADSDVDGTSSLDVKITPLVTSAKKAPATRGRGGRGGKR